MTREELISKEYYGYDADKGIWSKAKEKFLEGSLRKDGYIQVPLKCVDGKKIIFYYHRALWYLVYGPIPEGYQINHINEDKTDNRLCNLNLMTCKENINYGTHNKRVATKLRGIPKSEKHKAKLRNHPNKSKPVVAIDKDGNVVYEFASTSEAGRNGFNFGNVSACCRNCFNREGNNIYKGLRWYFKSEWEQMQKASLQ